jgi:superfamily II DNA helicase RecQ
MDEAHIHVQHGTSFCEDIRALRIEFFRKVYGNQPRDLRPRLIALTATFPTTYNALLSTLLTVDMSIGDCVVRGSPEDFRQQEISMKMDICSKKSQFVSKGLVIVAEFLQDNPDCSVIVFCNSRKQSQHFAKELEKKLDHKRLLVDVVNINGSLDKIDKFW